MTLNDVKNVLPMLEDVRFKLPDASFVPDSFHVTEIGQVVKKFIDCGGTVREEIRVSFQLWNANDFDHRLKPAKLLNIINMSERILGLADAEIEVEYQTGTIGKFGLEFESGVFLLTQKQTACLASDSCGSKANKSLESLTPEKSCCDAESNCC